MKQHLQQNLIALHELHKEVKSFSDTLKACRCYLEFTKKGVPIVVLYNRIEKSFIMEFPVTRAMRDDNIKIHKKWKEADIASDIMTVYKEVSGVYNNYFKKADALLSD